MSKPMAVLYQQPVYVYGTVIDASRSLLRTLLQRRGFIVTETQSLAGTLTACKRYDVSLVIADVECIDDINFLKSSPDIWKKIILTSVFPLTQDDAFFVKPFNPRILSDYISTIPLSSAAGDFLDLDAKAA